MKHFKLKGLENFLKKCENLEKEQDSFGKKWSPLKQSTINSRKAQKITHNKMLFATGLLQSSLISGVENDTAFVALNATYKGFAYARVHQFGSKKVPARSFLPIDEKLTINQRVVKEM